MKITPIRAWAIHVTEQLAAARDEQLLYKVREHKGVNRPAYDVLVKGAADKRGTVVYTILADLL